MPSKRLCLGPGPPHYATPGTSRCTLHPWKGSWSTASPEQRGYGAEWKRLRLEILKRDHYTCQECGAKATDVDHITPKSMGGTNDRANLRALCGPCHDRKTERERIAGRVRSRWG